MQEAVPVGHGAMSAILGLDAAAVTGACEAAATEVGGVVTPANLNAPGQVVIAGEAAAVTRAGEIAKEHKKSWIPQQFENPANLEVHRRTTAQEVLADFPEGIDFLITGYGTGGHITGVTEVVKKKFPKMKTFCVEPEKSTVASGGTHSPHKLQGIGPGFVPAIMNRDLIDGYIQVSEDDGFASYVAQVASGRVYSGPE